jgi:hypothetical protein
MAFFLKNISYVLDVYGASNYIVHHLKKITNNMGQTFGKEKHFHFHTTLFLNNYVRYIN